MFLDASGNPLDFETAVVSGRATHGFNLVPKNPKGAPFVGAQVWIDDNDAAREVLVHMVDSLGMRASAACSA